MQVVDEKLIKEIVDVIVNEIDPEKILLFGSRARGGYSESSDIDLLIVKNKAFGTKDSRWNELVKARRALSKFKVAKDILIYNNDEIEYWKDSLNHIIPTCLKEGVGVRQNGQKLTDSNRSIQKRFLVIYPV